MSYSEIIPSDSGTFFSKNGEKLYKKNFKEILKFHEPGIAPVSDEKGWYYIDIQGKRLTNKYYQRAFGFYFNRAAVVDDLKWYHVDNKIERTYFENYEWCGNYQEEVCTVREFKNNYFHIDLSGNPIYPEKYLYAGDFKVGYACVKSDKGWKHIDKNGNDLNGKLFQGLGVYHKNFATAKDDKGWFHINKQGNALYGERYTLIEPFYNGFALVENFENNKLIIDEKGKIHIVL